MKNLCFGPWYLEQMRKFGRETAGVFAIRRVIIDIVAVVKVGRP